MEIPSDFNEKPQHEPTAEITFRLCATVKLPKSKATGGSMSIDMINEILCTLVPEILRSEMPEFIVDATMIHHETREFGKR